MSSLLKNDDPVKREQNRKRLEAVIGALGRISDEVKSSIFEMSQQLSELDIIQYFNQQASDLFDFVLQITKKMGKEREYKVTGYKSIFENALKINVKMPIDKFTLVVLEYAPEIYAQEEDCFLSMTIPDAKVNVGNEFSMIRSEMFKSLWVTLNSLDKKAIGEKVVDLTTYAHMYLYKSVLLSMRK